MIKDTVGLIHFVASIVALITGAIVLLKVKGTRSHLRYGYAYCIAMIVTLTSSFMIYRLYGRFGVFHYLAILSGFTLIKGMLPMLKGNKEKNSVNQHFKSMYWSVVGLYAAFAAELFVRVQLLYRLFSDVMPKTLFHFLALFASLSVILISLVVFLKKKSGWIKLANKFK